jgi:hypothetical protein
MGGIVNELSTLLLFKSVIKAVPGLQKSQGSISLINVRLAPPRAAPYINPLWTERFCPPVVYFNLQEVHFTNFLAV